MTEETFLVGIDFGSFKTSIAASNGRRETLPTAVGWAKDDVARAMLGREYVFGEEIGEDELALEIVRPFAKGALKYGDLADLGLSEESRNRSCEAAQLVLQHAVSLVESPPNLPLYAVLGAPSRATIANKQVLLDAARGAFDAVAIVAEPFTVAYSMNRLRKTLVVDIGAGTIDICPLFGTYPDEQDQVTLHIGGDSIDEDFAQRLHAAHPEVQFNVDMARQIKERYGFVHDVNESAKVDLPVRGVPTRFDVTDLLKESCKTIVGPIIDGIQQVVSRVDPRHQRVLVDNILLGGGGSQLKGLDRLLEEGVKSLGGGRVERVYDSVFAGAVGALHLAMAMPAASWLRLSDPNSTGESKAA